MATEAALENGGITDLQSVPESFEVHDAGTVSWVVRKITEARRYADRVRAWAAAELRRAEREEQFFLMRFGPQMEIWCRKELVRSKRKSISLPGGVIGFRQSPQSLLIRSEEDLIKWCRKYLPAAIVTTQQVLKQTVKDHVQSSGEVPDGAEISPKTEKFFIR